MNSIPRKIRFLPDLAVECCLTHSLLAILPHNILIWKLFTGMNSFAFISSYSQCHKKGKNMLSECKFFSCLRCFWLREKKANQKSTNSKAKIIKPQKSEKRTRDIMERNVPAAQLSWKTSVLLGYLPLSQYVRFPHNQNSGFWGGPGLLLPERACKLSTAWPDKV